MKREIPKYDFKPTAPIEIEVTSLSAIYQASRAKLIIPHRQNFYGIFYFLNSHGKHFIDFREHAIKKGEIHLISNEQVHYFKDIKNSRGEVLFFTPDFLKNDLPEQFFDQITDSPILSPERATRSEVELLFQQIKKTIATSNRNKIRILQKYLEIILLELSPLLNSGLQAKDKHQLRFLQFKRDLKAFYRDEKSTGFYAQKQFISTKTLNLAVHKSSGKSTKQFINDYVLLCAKRLLVNSQYGTSEIAYALGFDEPTNFVKFFKQREGLTPLQFRKRFVH